MLRVTLVSLFLLSLTSSGYAQWEMPANVDLGTLGGSPTLVASTTHLFVDGTYRSADQGASWEVIPYALEFNKPSAFFHYNGRLFSGHNSSGQCIFYSDDGGLTWQGVAGGPTTSQVYGFYEMDGLLFAHVPGNVYKSTDGGLTWAAKGTGMGALVAMTALNGDLFATSTGNNGVWKSTDQGETWERSNTGISGFDLFGQAVWTMGGKLYYQPQGVGFFFESTDQALSWTKFTPSYGASNAARGNLQAEGRVYIRTRFTSEKIFLSVDGGASWQDITDNLPNSRGQIGDRLLVYGGYLWAVSSGTVYRLDTSTLPTDAETHAETPTRFRVLEQYPNPFTNQVTLRWAVDSPGAVTVTVYDVLGRTLASEAYRWRAAGEQALSLDTEAWSPGLYFYHIKAGTSYQTGSMVLVR